MLFPSLFLLIVPLIAALDTIPLWPLPSSSSFGTTSQSLNGNFNFVYNGKNQIVQKGIARYLQLINVPSTSSGTIQSCSFTISDDSTTKGIIDANETYQIVIDSKNVCSITAETAWGALRALETFSQLLTRESSNGQVQVEGVPLTVKDVARYGHRGILIDTARHYLSLTEIQRIIDSLPTSKFNVFHWHMIDAESFPFNSVSEPTMVNGAFSPSQTYTIDDLEAVRNYAYERGVEVIIEIDVPGHAASWTKGKPEIMADCFVKYSYNINDFALNPSLDATYTTVNNILGDIIKATGSPRIHLGGDEVVYGCWKNDTSVINFYNQMGYTSYDQVLGYFVDRVDKYVTGLGVRVTHWEEVFTANCQVPAGTIFQVWTDSSKISQVTSAKYPVIASPSDYWYLNIATNTWTSMYSYDPTQGLTSEEASYIVGGETALWGEYIDDSNIETNIYPRACAVAERLWSPSTVVDTTDAGNRLIIQKCRLVNRGFHSTPVKPADYCSKTYV